MAGATTTPVTIAAAVLAAATRNRRGRRRTATAVPTTAAAAIAGQACRPGQSSAKVACSTTRATPTPRRASHAKAGGDSGRGARDAERDPVQDERDGEGDQHGRQQVHVRAALVEVGEATGGDEHAETGDHLGAGQRARRCGPGDQRQGETSESEQRTERDEEHLDAGAAEPAGTLRSEDVQGEQAQRDHRQGLGAGAQVPPGQPPGKSRGGRGEGDEGGGATADAHQGPGDGEEHHRGDQHAQGPEAQQDLRHRRRAEPAARPRPRHLLPGRDRVGGRRPVVIAGSSADVRRGCRRGRPGARRGRGARLGRGQRARPQLDQQRVGGGEGQEEPLGQRSVQRQAAGLAPRCPRHDRAGAVGAALRVGKSGHGSMRPHPERRRALIGDSGRVSMRAQLSRAITTFPW